MNIRVKILGRQRTFLYKNVALPDGTYTIAELIAALVRQELAAYNKRQNDIGLLRVMTEGDIRIAHYTGKLAFSAQERASTVTEEEAVYTALCGFRDGLYFVFIDDKRMNNRDDTLTLDKETNLLLMRMTALVGG